MTRRLPQLAAITFAVLFACALMITPLSPGIDRSGESIAAHLNEHATALRVQALLAVLGTLALVVVLGFARTRLDGAAGYVFTIGSAVVVTETAVEMWFISGLALHPDELDPGTARLLVDIASMWGPMLTVADVMVAVPVALAAANRRFPRWLGVLAAIFAVEQLVETVTILGGPGFIAPGGVMNLYVGGPLFIVFFLALGLTAAEPDHVSTSKNESPSSGVPSI